MVIRNCNFIVLREYPTEKKNNLITDMLLNLSITPGHLLLFTSTISTHAIHAEQPLLMMFLSDVNEDEKKFVPFINDKNHKQHKKMSAFIFCPLCNLFITFVFVRSSQQKNDSTHLAYLRLKEYFDKAIMQKPQFIIHF